MRYLACIFLLTVGCASTPCVPTVEIQEKLVETKCVIPIAAVECAAEIPAPPFDAEDPKGWALEVERITRQNKINAKACEEALRSQIAEHNRSEILCN